MHSKEEKIMDMNEKMTYEEPEAEIVFFEDGDIITNSDIEMEGIDGFEP